MELKSIKVRGLKYQNLIRAPQNLKIFDLILTSKFEVFQGSSSKNLYISNLNNPQNLILNLKNAVLILTLNFEAFFEGPQ